MFKLNVTSRKAGSESNSSLRRKGIIPAVYFHKGDQSESLSISAKDLSRALSSHEPVIQLSNKKMAIVKEIQVDPISGKVLHVSMQGVIAGESFQKEVPVVCTHDENAAWVKQGMVLSTSLKTVTIETTPENVPESIEVDVSHLEKGDVLRVKDLKLPTGVKVIDDEEEQVAHVMYPHVEEESTTEAVTEEAATSVESEEDKK